MYTKLYKVNWNSLFMINKSSNEKPIDSIFFFYLYYPVQLAYFLQFKELLGFFRFRVIQKILSNWSKTLNKHEFVVFIKNTNNPQNSA